MEKLKEFSESILLTGSGMNHRTFRDDESWNSLQSTILAGNLSTDADSSVTEQKENLTILNKDSYELSKEESQMEDENMLNINIDALPDDDVFFDCPSILSPRPFSKDYRSPVRAKVHTPRYGQQLSKQFLEVDYPSAMCVSSGGDSGMEEEKTGALLVQLVEEFEDGLKDHAQSTPKLASASERTSSLASSQNLSDAKSDSSRKSIYDIKDSAIHSMQSSGVDVDENIKKKLNFQSANENVKLPSCTQPSPVKVEDKENFYNGKYSRAVHLTPKKPSPEIRPSTAKRYRRVAEIKEFFENRSRMCEGNSTTHTLEHKLPCKKTKTTLHPSKLPLATGSRKPSYQTMETVKLLKTSKILKMSKKNSVRFSPNGSSSYVLRNLPAHISRSLRPSSCSELSSEQSYSTDSLTNVSANLMSNKSKSTEDLSDEPVNGIAIKTAIEMKMITTRQYCLLSQNRSQKKGLGKSTGLYYKSPKKTSKISSIMKRKSFGFVSSPVKPVKELRKIFSPGMSSNAAETKRARKNAAALPRIIIN